MSCLDGPASTDCGGGAISRLTGCAASFLSTRRQIRDLLRQPFEARSLSSTWRPISPAPITPKVEIVTIRSGSTSGRGRQDARRTRRNGAEAPRGDPPGHSASRDGQGMARPHSADSKADNADTTASDSTSLCPHSSYFSLSQTSTEWSTTGSGMLTSEKLLARRSQQPDRTCAAQLIKAASCMASQS
jgi:hypothetical protein